MLTPFLKYPGQFSFDFCPLLAAFVIEETGLNAENEGLTRTIIFQKCRHLLTSLKIRVCWEWEIHKQSLY